MSKKKVLSKFTILCWATFIAILGHGLDTFDGGLSAGKENGKNEGKGSGIKKYKLVGKE